MKDVLDIAQRLIKVLSQESDQVGISYFVKWKTQALSLLQEAKLYQKKYEKLSSIKISSIDTFQNVLKQEMRQDIATEALIVKMYRFLNEVGETLRGETISYEVTLTTGKGKELTIQTFTLTLEQFLSITAKTSSRLTLRHTSSALKELQMQQIKGREWTQDQIKELERYRANVKRNQGGHWGKINKGNTLEGFRRKQIKGLSTTKSIAETMSGTQGFWKGGDIDLLQIKGDRASVTNFKTCVLQIENLFRTLTQLPEPQNLNSKSEVEKYVNSSVGQIDTNINKITDENVKNIIQGLQKQFFVNL